jgi:hypothetical protein
VDVTIPCNVTLLAIAYASTCTYGKLFNGVVTSTPFAASIQLPEALAVRFITGITAPSVPLVTLVPTVILGNVA